MAKQYRIDVRLQNQQAITAARALNAELSKLDQAAKTSAENAQRAIDKVGHAASQAAQKTTAARRAAGDGAGGHAGQTVATTRMSAAARAARQQEIVEARAAGAVMLSDKSKHIAEMEALEQRWLKREYAERTAWQAKTERATNQQANTAAKRVATDRQRNAQQTSAIEDAYTKKDYDRRVAAERKKEQETARDTARAAAEKQHEIQQRGALEDSYAKKDYDRRVAHERKKQIAEEQAAKRAAAAKQRDDDRLATIEDQHLKRDYDRRIAHERRKEQEANRAAKRQVAIEERKQKELADLEDKWLRREQRDRVAFERRKQEHAAAAQARVTSDNEAVVGGLAATAAMLSTAIAKSISSTIHDITAEKRAASAATTDMQKNLRVEAALMGRKNDATFLGESLAFRMKSGLDEAGASNFVRQFEGSLPVGIEKGNITRQVADELKIAAAQRARRIGGDESTHGDLAGILGQFTKIGSAQEGLGKLEAIRYGLTKGRGDDTPLTQQFLKAAGTLVKEGGAVGSPEEFAALIGVMSLKNKDEAGTLAVQLNRAVRLGVHRQRKVKGAQDTQGNYLKKLGVTEKDSIETALDKIVPDLKKADLAGRDIQGYLIEHGFGQEEERIALVNAYENYQPLKIRMAEQRAMGATAGPEQMNANREDQESPQARQDIAKQMDAANAATKGLRHTRFDALLAEAKQSPEYQKAEESWLARRTDWAVGIAKGDFDAPSERGQQERATYWALARLKKRARQAGVTEEELRIADNRSALGNGTDYEKQSDYANEVEGLINKRQGGAPGGQIPGGNTAADIKPVLEQLVKAIQDFNANERKKAPAVARAPAPLPPPPPGNPIRPGAN